MKRASGKITASEREVLELLWEHGEALSSSEIVALSEDKTWKPSYIHLMINSLLKKNIIRVSGFKQTTKNYARTFEPTMSREEFSIYILREENHMSSATLSLLFGTLLEEETDEEVIQQLSDMVEKRRQELKEKKRIDK